MLGSTCDEGKPRGLELLISGSRPENEIRRRRHQVLNAHRAAAACQLLIAAAPESATFGGIHMKLLVGVGCRALEFLCHAFETKWFDGFRIGLTDAPGH